MAKAKLGEMHAKGTALIWKFGRDANVNHYAHEWIEETKTVMREYLDESYISRFDVLVSRAQNDVIQPIEITERLKELKGFIQELQVSS